MHKWQEILESFNDKLTIAERESCARVSLIFISFLCSIVGYEIHKKNINKNTYIRASSLDLFYRVENGWST